MICECSFSMNFELTYNPKISITIDDAFSSGTGLERAGIDGPVR